MNIRENVQTEEPTKLLGIAAIIQSLPLPLVYWVLTFLTIIIAFIAWLFVAWLAVIAMVIFWLVVAFIAFKIGIGVFHNYHDVMRTGYETRAIKEQSRKVFISNETALAKLDMYRQLPPLASYAMDNGFNVEFGGMKVSSWKSHIASLQSGGAGFPELPAPNIILPAKTKMIEVARRHDFSKDNIFLALAGADEDVTTTIGGYVHAANDGSTGSGKTSNWRGQLVQFIKADVGCILLNPHFSLTTKAGDDWKPIARALESQGSYGLDMPRVVTQFANIGAVLCWLATIEIDRRFQLMRQGCFDYQPLYAYIDEWPSIVTNCKEAPEYLRTILQRGRAVEVCVSVNSQGFLANDTDLRGSARENFDTAFFLGGSTYSGAKMLDLSEKALKDMIATCQEPLGKGVAFLRNNAYCPNAQLVRLPFADNEFVYHCLGHADGYQLPPEEVTVVVDERSNMDMDDVYEACMQLKEEGKEVSARSVAPLVQMGKTKVAELMKKLESQGVVIR
jgi:hypothetical protein